MVRIELTTFCSQSKRATAAQHSVATKGIEPIQKDYDSYVLPLNYIAIKKKNALGNSPNAPKKEAKQAKKKSKSKYKVDQLLQKGILQHSDQSILE